ncbi:unnamed protein product [Larinioides sclopetarius]|uniref:Uncharacterized protein n=1 Tax=Larinioides sclopetarius TaxID=280406 RepID=A0AAV2AN26_9ARAC
MSSLRKEFLSKPSKSERVLHHSIFELLGKVGFTLKSGDLTAIQGR